MNPSQMIQSAANAMKEFALGLPESGATATPTRFLSTMLVSLGVFLALEGAAFAQSCTANAGANQTMIGTTNQVLLAGSVGGGATGGTWSGGAGTFVPNANTLNAYYQPTAAEEAAGSLTLTLTTTGGSCTPATSTMTITSATSAKANHCSA